MNIYDGALRFGGTWRSYQQRVLDHTEEYLDDGRVHIVAAPGSGKTTLGIELFRRLGEPCLILSPSITIRQQWIARIKEGFLLEGNKVEDWCSNNIQKPKAVTAITYQALHSCMKHYAGVLKEEGEEEEGLSEEETVDYREFDIYQTIREAKVGTICLDEAHHLRSEWWKALEEFLRHVPQMKIISLTATPPYDSTPAQWKRYIDMCGPIDEEIFTPELVKEGSLCPHQDYVYFNWPTKEETHAAETYLKKAGQVVEEIKQDREFVQMIAAHEGLLNPMEYSEKFLDHPKYFSSILIFLQEMGVPFSRYLKELLGTKGKLPRLNHEWMEVLLQGFLYEDTEAYPCDKVYREQIIEKLKEAGCIRRKKVCLAKNEEITKLLVKSAGKLNSIGEIVRSEQEGLGESLRLLILCDFIKKEMLSYIGNEEKEIKELGAVPIFEYLRRQKIPGLRLGVLSGSVVIVPSDTEGELKELLAQYGCEGTLSPLSDTGYSRAAIKGNSHHMVAVITELFTRGRVNALVGTKSLLGEGWDSPCINSLVLATYVGSFMLSNQMRGRAIRVFKGEPDKTSNIWHLACILPQKKGKTKGSDLSGDYETLERRFEAFLGVSCREAVIESGIGRLGIGDELDSKRDIEKVNERMRKRARDRAGLRAAWEQSLKVIHGDMAVEEVQEIEKEKAELGYLFANAVACEIVSAIGAVLFFFCRVFLEAGLNVHSGPAVLAGFGFLLCAVGVLRYGYRIVSLLTPQKRVKKTAEGILAALIQIGKIEEPEHCRVATEETDVLVGAYLKGGSTRDKTLFAACLGELWGVIDNPRYLLMRKRGKAQAKEAYAVPEIFGKHREEADIFASCMRKVLGSYVAVYTRTPEGRRLLLKARTRSFVNKNDQLLTGKKQVKGKYE